VYLAGLTVDLKVKGRGSFRLRNYTQVGSSQVWRTKLACNGISAPQTFPVVVPHGILGGFD
ncbi:MAG: hypothetical protein ACOYNF_16185, partial [Rhodoferax sp.]